MDLWIRSQDKERIQKMSDLSIMCYQDEEKDTNDITFYIVNDFDYCITNALGAYKTKKRAIEVLTEIHQRLIDLQILEIAPDTYITIGKKGRDVDCVYQMPKK